MAPRELFRREAIEGAATAAGMGERFVVVRPLDRLGLRALAGVVVLGLLWSVLGTVRVTVRGEGILLEPGAAISLSGGADPSAMLASLDQPQLIQRVAQLTDQIEALSSQGARTGTMREQETTARQDSLDRQLAQIEKRVETLNTLIASQERASSKEIAERRAALVAQEKEARALLAQSERDLEQAATLMAQGAMSESGRTRLRDERLTAQTRLDTIQAQLDGLTLERVSNEVARLELQERLERLEAERDELGVRKLELQRELYEASTGSSNAVAELQRQLDAAALELERRHRGSDVEADDAEVPDQDSSLIVVCFMDAADAKRVAPGMPMRVSPDSVEAERFGTALGRVREVTTYPVTPAQAEVLLGNEALAERLAASGRSVILVGALEPAPTASGVAWTTAAGPPSALSPGTTLAAEVTVERRRPVSWLLPWLRRLTGVGG